jgi:hypothetical protein
MRLHRTNEVLAPWSTGAPVLDPARLAAVRIEPVFRQRRPALALDFYLAGDSGDTIVTTVLADPASVIERDRDPLIFPAGMPGGEAFALALAERVLPHLEALVLGAEPLVEHVLEFAAAPRFEAARRAGCFGAAPLRDALTRLAPYRFAQRFARGRSVRIDAPDAVGGWALLRGIGSVGVAQRCRDGVALAWYGDAPLAGERTDVAIVAADGDPGSAACVLRLDAEGTHRLEVVDPLPLDVGISFDPAEGPVRRWFAVECAPEPASRAHRQLDYVAAGGSTGRIRVVLSRLDGQRRPAADTDEAWALVAALAAEGFDAELAAGPDELDGADLIHLIGTRDGRRARAVVDAARRAGVPVALHAHDEDAAHGGWWGATVTRHCFEYGSDEHDLARYLDMLAKRAVSVGAGRAEGAYAPDEAGVDDATFALREAAVVYAATSAEADGIRARAGRRGPVVVVPPLARLGAPLPIGPLVGPDRFALCHAPIGPISNQLLVARCAAVAAIPLVVTGPVADASYLERVREFGGPNLILLPFEPEPGVTMALRAAASIVVDAAWVGEGGSRLAASLLSGARLVVADRRRFDVPAAGLRRFDPADAAALTRALGEAWDEALRSPGGVASEIVTTLAPTGVVRAIVRGYASTVCASEPVTS